MVTPKKRIAQESFITGNAQGHSRVPCTGVYFLCRLPEQWKLFAYLNCPDEESDHVTFWAEHVCAEVSRTWAEHRVSQQAKGDLHALWGRYELSLRQRTYAFPRGRVSIGASGRYLVLQGNDWKLTGFKKRDIENAYGLMRPQWQFDIHEQCQQEDAEAVRELFKIKERWPSAGLDFGFGD